jgi:hypothetical protein
MGRFYGKLQSGSSYLGKECPSCETIFKTGESVVLCPLCKTLYHMSCWQENNGCAMPDCHANDNTINEFDKGYSDFTRIISNKSNKVTQGNDSKKIEQQLGSESELLDTIRIQDREKNQNVSPPPMPDSVAGWYYSPNGEVAHGPVTKTQLEDMLSQGTLRATTLVWSEFLDDWTIAGQVQALQWQRPKTPPPLPPHGVQARPMQPNPQGIGAAESSSPSSLNALHPTNGGGYSRPPALIPDHLTLVHMDRSAKGRLMKVWGKVLGFLALGLGIYIYVASGGRYDGGMFLFILIVIMTAVILHVTGSFYEYIYGRDRTG